MEPFRSVDSQQVFVGSGQRLEDVIGRGDSFAQEKFIEQAKFLRWKNVRTEIEIVARVVDEFEWQHGDVRTHFINAFCAVQVRANARKADSSGKPPLE